MGTRQQYKIYLHICDFIKNRGFTISAEPLQTSTYEGSKRDYIVSLFVQIGYYRIDAIKVDDNINNILVILLLRQTSKYANHSSDLRNLLSSLESEKQFTQKENKLFEIIIVTPENMLGKKNMTDVIRNFRSPNDQLPYINLYPYHIFSTIIPDAVTVPKHELLPIAEAEEYLRTENLTRFDLPIIKDTDPPVIWAGGRAGMFVKVLRPSETTGLAWELRYIIKDSVLY